ncbi:MAG: LysM domain-containing protein [Planctomycetota bacterium]
MISELNEPQNMALEKTVEKISKLPLDPALEADPLNYLHVVKLNSSNFFPEKEEKETAPIAPNSEIPERKSNFFLLREKIRFSKIHKFIILGLLCGWISVTHWWGQSTPLSISQENLLALKETSLSKTLELNKKLFDSSKNQSQKTIEKAIPLPESNSSKTVEIPSTLLLKTEAVPAEYKVVKGDSLYKIALEKLGSAHYVEELIRYNQLDSSSKIRIGQVLKIPPGFPKIQGNDDKEKENPEAVVSKSKEEEYRVMEGDSLYKIAERKLGSKQQAQYLAEYNQLKDPSLIRVGQILKIPEKNKEAPKKEENEKNPKTTSP